jgi:hypothetical protein
MAKRLFDLTAWTEQQLSERYVLERVRLRKICLWGLEGKRRYGSARSRGLRVEDAYGPRLCAYPNTAMMNVCKRELERRGLPVPQVSLPE